MRVYWVLLGALALGACAPETLAWSRSGLGAGEWWRAWTGHYTHWGAAHAWSNAAVCMLLIYIQGDRARTWVLASLWVAPVMSLVLLWTVPSMLEYRGLSGLNCFWLVGAWAALSARGRQGFWIGSLLVFVEIFKIAYDVLTGAASPFLPVEIETAWQAHTVGLVCGFIFWSKSAWRKRETS